MKKILGWDTELIFKLLQDIACRGEARISKVFSRFAIQTDKKPNSVRNFYYKYMGMVKNDENLKHQIEARGIDLSKLSAHFDKMQTIQLLKNVFTKAKESSVRKACFDLANGDSKQAIRLQNKYRNTLRNQPKLAIEAKATTKRNDNIVVMPHHETSKADIEALFWGLVRLVKHTTENELQTQIRREVAFSESELSKAKIDLKKKELALSQLREQNKLLRSKLEEIASLRVENQSMHSDINSLVSYLHSDNMEKLKLFLEKISKKLSQKEN